MSISFQQLLEMLVQPTSPVDRLRYCAMTEDIVHVVVYTKEPTQGFGEVFLTQAQFDQVQRQFPGLNLAPTGTFPIPTKR